MNYGVLGFGAFGFLGLRVYGFEVWRFGFMGFRGLFSSCRVLRVLGFTGPYFRAGRKTLREASVEARAPCEVDGHPPATNYSVLKGGFRV